MQGLCFSVNCKGTETPNVGFSISGVLPSLLSLPSLQFPSPHRNEKSPYCQRRR